MGYEIDFLAVGEESKSGDAIAVRFGNLFGARAEQTVVLIDGGFQTTTESIVKHVETYYQTRTIDLVVSTHPDADHINGLTGVLEELDVRELWMHRPSSRRQLIEQAIRSLGNDPYADQLRASMVSAATLEQIASRKGIPIREPFAGLTHASGSLMVVGPTEDFYNSVLRAAASPNRERGSLLDYVAKAIDILARAAETFGIETLTDEGETSPINNTCAITLLGAEGQLFLFTADAGMPALNAAASYLETTGYTPAMLRFIQVPHHGSRRNVGPSVLDRLLGPRRPAEENARTAFVSCAPDGEPKHPSRRVTNAFRRRGSPVHATKGVTKWHHNNAPSRNWGPSTPLPFFTEVED